MEGLGAMGTIRITSSKKPRISSISQKCHECGKWGHFAKHCRSKPQQQQSQKTSSRRDVNEITKPHPDHLDDRCYLWIYLCDQLNRQTTRNHSHSGKRSSQSYRGYRIFSKSSKSVDLRKNPTRKSRYQITNLPYEGFPLRIKYPFGVNWGVQSIDENVFVKEECRVSDGKVNCVVNVTCV